MTGKTFPKIRIRECEKGYVVEFKTTKYFFFKIWKHAISCYGLENEPFYYRSLENAINCFCSFFRREVEIIETGLFCEKDFRVQPIQEQGKCLQMLVTYKGGKEDCPNIENLLNQKDNHK
jgi:hypothetical protein